MGRVALGSDTKSEEGNQWTSTASTETDKSLQASPSSLQNVVAKRSLLASPASLQGREKEVAQIFGAVASNMRRTVLEIRQAKARHATDRADALMHPLPSLLRSSQM